MEADNSILIFIGASFFGIIAVIVIAANLVKRFAGPATTAGSSWDSENDSSFWTSSSSSLADDGVPGDRDGDGDVDAADSGWSDDSSSDSSDSSSSDD